MHHSIAKTEHSTHRVKRGAAAMYSMTTNAVMVFFENETMKTNLVQPLNKIMNHK